MTQFADLGLSAPLLEMLAAEQYTTPTPIQAQAIPHILAGRDLLGIAQTGTGKTAAFALPVLHRLDANRRRTPRRGCRVLVLAPTRELASQIDEAVRTYGRGFGVTSAVVFGGVGAIPQIRKMAAGVDFLVATPGRLLDHMQQGNIRLEGVEVLILDEVDRMLDMGFIAPVRRIVSAIPAHRQTLLFSATMPDDIRKFAAELLDDPVEVTVTPPSSTVEMIDQRVIHVAAREKPALLASLMSDRAIARALVFTRTKRGADRVTRHLAAAGVAASAIHGNKSQGQREQALAAFRSGSARVLVATDIAARGIDVDGITHVINFELPNIPESYVHRIGRTARAGAGGAAISFCDAEEREHLRGIESLIRRRLPAEKHEGEAVINADAAPGARPTQKPLQQARPPKAFQTKPAQAKAQARPQPAKATAKPTGAAKATPKRRAQPKLGAAAATGRKAPAEAEPAKRADQPLRRLNGIGRVTAAPDGQPRHDLSHLSFLAPASGPAPAMKMARAGSR